MLDKLKGLMEMEERLRSFQKTLGAQETTLKSNSSLLKTLEKQNNASQQQISSIISQQQELAAQLQKELQDFTNIKQRLHEELNDIKVLKSRLKDGLVQEIVSEVNTELVTQLGRLRTDVKSYNDLKVTLQQNQLELQEVRAELQKFLAISKHIKETDFELSNHAKKLANADREKVELLKRIDYLERLLAKERRDNRNQHPRH